MGHGRNALPRHSCRLPGRPRPQVLHAGRHRRRPRPPARDPARTLDDWLAGDRGFAAATVAERLYARAIGFSQKVEKLYNNKGEIVRETYVEHYRPDVSACIFWLRNRRREWRDGGAGEGGAGKLMAELEAAGERLRLAGAGGAGQGRHAAPLGRTAQQMAGGADRRYQRRPRQMVLTRRGRAPATMGSPASTSRFTRSERRRATQHQPGGERRKHRQRHRPGDGQRRHRQIVRRRPVKRHNGRRDPGDPRHRVGDQQADRV